MDWLNTRGYEKKDIVLFDREKDGLKEAGFISEEQGTLYKGYRVLHSLDEDYFMDGWFHDSPLPPTSFDRAKYILKFPAEPKRRQLEERKSYLPALLFKDAFWINLAVPMDDVFLGVDGAAANISLGSVNNYGRFYRRKPWHRQRLLKYGYSEIWEKRIFQYSISPITRWLMVSVLIPSIQKNKTVFISAEIHFHWILLLGRPLTI